MEASDSLKPRGRRMGSAVDSFSLLLFKTFTLACSDVIVSSGSRLPHSSNETKSKVGRMKVESIETIRNIV